VILGLSIAVPDDQGIFAYQEVCAYIGWWMSNRIKGAKKQKRELSSVVTHNDDISHALPTQQSSPCFTAAWLPG
jgi:hypothetical protein